MGKDLICHGEDGCPDVAAGKIEPSALCHTSVNEKTMWVVSRPDLFSI